MLADWYKTLCDYYAQYQANCPYSQYTGYFVLGFLALVFFVLWRQTAGKNKYLKGVNRTLQGLADYHQGNGPTACFAPCCATPPAAQACKCECKCECNVQEVMDTFYRMHTSTIEALRATQADGMNKLSQSNATALSHLDGMARTFAETESE
jgi:hypothetical protein